MCMRHERGPRCCALLNANLRPQFTFRLRTRCNSRNIQYKMDLYIFSVVLGAAGMAAMAFLGFSSSHSGAHHGHDTSGHEMHGIGGHGHSINAGHGIPHASGHAHDAGCMHLTAHTHAAPHSWRQPRSHRRARTRSAFVSRRRLAPGRKQFASPLSRRQTPKASIR